MAGEPALENRTSPVGTLHWDTVPFNSLVMRNSEYSATVAGMVYCLLA